MAASLFALAILTALFLPPGFIAVLLAYIVITTAYSIRLKRAALVDIFTIAGLYTVRIVAGAIATGILLSVWLLCILDVPVLCPRCRSNAARNWRTSTPQPSSRVAGRGYYPEDMDVLIGMGAASGFSATLVLKPTRRSLPPPGSMPARSCCCCFALLLLLDRPLPAAGARGHMHDDPIVFATKDRLEPRHLRHLRRSCCWRRQVPSTSASSGICNPLPTDRAIPAGGCIMKRFSRRPRPQGAAAFHHQFVERVHISAGRCDQSVVMRAAAAGGAAFLRKQHRNLGLRIGAAGDGMDLITFQRAALVGDELTDRANSASTGPLPRVAAVFSSPSISSVRIARAGPVPQ